MIGNVGAHIGPERVVNGRDDHRLPVTAILRDGVLKPVDGEHSDNALRLLSQTQQTIAKVLDTNEHFAVRVPFDHTFCSVHAAQTIAINCTMIQLVSGSKEMSFYLIGDVPSALPPMV